MVLRAYPRIATITVIHHRRFSFLGIENVHILEYKSPAEIFKKRFFVSLEKFFRRVRAFLLKLDTATTRGIEWTQVKRESAPPVISMQENIEHHSIPMNEISASHNTKENTIVLKNKKNS